MKTIYAITTLAMLLTAAYLVPSSNSTLGQEAGIPEGRRPARPGGTPRSQAAPGGAATGQPVARPVIDIPRSALARQMHFRDWTIRETAADSLWRIGRPAVPALIQAVGDPDPYTRVLAIDALAHIGPAAEDAVPALIAALEDPVEEVRQYAARALGQIGPAAYSAVPALIEKLQGPRQ